jgi:hypothetical protein
VKISTILDKIDSGDVALPVFQRGYVWNRDQVRGFFASLYRGYPVGSFLMWLTPSESAQVRGGALQQDGSVSMLLDGQQRATTLYGVIRGIAPRFFEGQEKTFTNLYFNLEDESFEFYGPAKMADNPLWVNVTSVMKGGLMEALPRLQNTLGSSPQLITYIERINRLHQVCERDVHVDEVTGADKTLDVVVEIFNRVNSGGTKLSKGDLALATLGAKWPDARDLFNQDLRGWAQAGFDFKLDWWLRAINAVLTGEARFSALEGHAVADVRKASRDAKDHMDSWLNTIAGQLGLDHDRVMLATWPMIVLARHTQIHGGKPPSALERDRLLYWAVQAGMWGRYAGSTESLLAQDLRTVEAEGVTGLVDVLRRSRGDLRVRPENFSGYGMGARFYAVLYLMTRTRGARDWGHGGPLASHLLGRLSSLQVHHIFPKAALYEYGYGRAQVNDVANFCFLTQKTNLDISATPPATYMPKVEAEQPGALASQWVPTERALWTLDRYPDFLKERQRLLAEATNDLLDSLWDHEAAHSASPLEALPLSRPVVVIEDDTDGARDQEVDELLTWLTELGFAEAERDVEVAHPGTGEVLAIAEAYWPNGLQEGLGDPVVLELDPEMADLRALEGLGIAVFTSCTALRELVERRRQEQLGVEQSGAEEFAVKHLDTDGLNSDWNPRPDAHLTAREEVLQAARRLAARSGGDGTFSAEDVVLAMKAAGTRFSESTIRTEVVSRMCSNAPDNHITTYDDLVRVDRGRYKLRE